jgi:hypothetical protein
MSNHVASSEGLTGSQFRRKEMKQFSSKFFGVAIAVVLLATVTFAAPAAKPKATGDADWFNAQGYNQEANATFNAINTKADGSLDAKGSAIYTDANVTYTMDVQALFVKDKTAWFTGQVTSVTVTGTNPKIEVGHWILYQVVDGGEPGIGVDEIFGEDLSVSNPTTGIAEAFTKVATAATPLGGPFVLTGGNVQVH